MVDAFYELGGGCYHSVLDIDNPDLALSGFRNLAIPVPSGSDSNAQGTLTSMELITTVPACDGNHWLIVADGGNTTNEKKLLVYLVTDSTVTYTNKSDDLVATYYGQLKASPDGTKLAGPGAIFNFDQATGSITTLKILPNDDRYVSYYGTSFSPNSRYIYYVLSENGSNLYIYQYDTESSDSLLSRQLVSHVISYFPYTMQLGPDERIYISKFGHDELAVIATPNERVTFLNPGACGYSEDGPGLKDADGNGGTCMLGLPNMMDAQEPGSIAINFSMIDTACGTVMFYPNNACASTYLWHFGDGDSSILKEPIHLYPDTGTYQVTLTINGITQVTRNLRIGIDRPVIAGDSVVSCNLSDLTHYTLANLNPEFTYQWSADGGTVLYVEDFENAVVQWDTIGTLYVTAINTLNQCSSADTIPVRPGNIRNNTISLYSGACFPGVPFALTGSQPDEINFMDSIIHFQWQSASSETGPWQDISSSDTLKDYTGLTAFDSVYYRRKVFNQWCENYSDPLPVAPKVRITRHPDDVSRCIEDGAALRKFFLGTEFTGSWQPYKAYFVVKKFVDLVGYVYVVEDSTDNFSYPNTLDSLEYDLTYFTYEYFFKINTPCGYYYSDTALIHGCYAGNWSVLLPDTVYTTEDSLVTLITHNDHCTGGPLLDGSYTYWQYSNNGTDWITINDTCGDTLRFTASYCENGFYYRTVFHEPCADEDRYSPAAHLFVTRTNFAKLMMRDYYDDNGAEPNDTTDWRNLYDPPSLLMRLSADGGTTHQPPDWGMNDTSYVYYTIRNIGSDNSKSAKLKMYWTFGGPHGADWPTAWQDIPGNRFHNLDTSKPNIYDSIYPYGDVINEIPIEVPSIAPGDSIRSYFPWGDFPNPLRYYVIQNGNFHYPNPRALCILARIETCPVDSFGLAFKETIATRQNIINNSRIVGRNTSVTNVQWQYGKKEVVQTVRRYPPVDGYPIRVAMEEVGNCGFGSYGRVKAVLSDALWEAWKDGGYTGSGYSIDSYGILSVTNLSGFEIGNIDLDPDSVATLTFEFELTSNPYFTLNCRYAVAQYQGGSSTPYGTFIMNVNAIGEPEEEGFVVQVNDTLDKEQDSLSGSNGSALEVDTRLLEQETESGESALMERSLFAYPNPFTNEVNFYFELAADHKVAFEIYNGLGAVVGRIAAREFAGGKHQVSFDGSHLAPGMYHCKVKIGDETETIRLVIVR